MKDTKTFACPDNCGKDCKITITEDYKLNEEQSFECPMGRGHMYGWKVVKEA